jgi:hypothetical protein
MTVLEMTSQYEYNVNTMERAIARMAKFYLNLNGYEVSNNFEYYNSKASA